ncbi:MAG: PHP domain-containing protein [Marinobacter sp.]|uniref:PHP domain-containing protein n=1 Tax=Marinobacter sp. TaxID=50741 RepID=UPI0029C50788|nr:PHP domain-containing protein [Marinobacter sp.]MDX5336065.1 PHP domain-containing protein [Marinobacter sp.]MDX5387112.1 PHP domain-containing protein [Marinobacter sp.]MDX5441009.1 PHP domain-containing protein [Alteromonadaceae bacterium]MDX5472483.1 PHP domain-containing protein [Marinobacter sp.]
MTIPQDPKPCIDLHCHSTASDGALTPEDLVARAAEQGVSHLALTDHDTIAGLAQARARGQELGLSLITGVELSCVWRSHTIHVVGLDFDEADPAFLEALAQQNENRWQRARLIADKLARLKVDGLLEKATALAGGDVPGRPHFAQVLVNAEVVPKTAHAFKRYLGSGKPGDVKACWPELSEVVQWITDAGGIAVLAHPRKYRLTATRLRELTADFRRAGGRAIEVSVSGQSSGDLGFVAELARREQLLASQGSDFHFPGAPWCELGRIMKMPEGLEPVWHHFRQPVSV